MLRLALGMLILLACVLRVKGLGATNLWLDEANSWLVASYPLDRLLANLRLSPLGPFYFILLKLWMTAFGDSERALRSLSLLASVLLLPATYAVGVRSVSRTGALLGTLLLTLSPLHLYFAQEARMYALVSLFATCCVTAYLSWRQCVAVPARVDDALAPPSRRRVAVALGLYVLFAILALYTNYSAAVLLLAVNLDAVLMLARARRPARLRELALWAAAQLVILAVCLPFLLTVTLGSAAASQSWRPPLGVAESLRAFCAFFLSAIQGRYFYPQDLVYAATGYASARSPHLAEAAEQLARLVVVYPLTLLALAVALSYPPRHALRRAPRVLYLCVLLPLAGGTVVSVYRSLELPRYFLFATIPLYLLLGEGLARMPGPFRLATLGAFLLSMVLGISQYRAVHSRDSDYREVARLLRRSVRPGDVVLIQPPEAGTSLAYYLRHDPLELQPIKAGGPLYGVLQPAPRKRSWVVLDYRSGWFETPPPDVRQALARPVRRDQFVAGSGTGVRVLEVDSSTVRPPLTPLPISR